MKPIVFNVQLDPICLTAPVFQHVLMVHMHLVKFVSTAPLAVELVQELLPAQAVSTSTITTLPLDFALAVIVYA